MGCSLQLHEALVNTAGEPLAAHRNAGVSWVLAAVATKMPTEGTAGNHPQVVDFILVTRNDLL